MARHRSCMICGNKHGQYAVGVSPCAAECTRSVCCVEPFITGIADGTNRGLGAVVRELHRKCQFSVEKIGHSRRASLIVNSSICCNSY